MIIIFFTIVCQCQVFLLVILCMNHDAIVNKTPHTFMWNIIDNMQFLLWSIKSDITTQHVCRKEVLFLPPISSSHCRLTAFLLTNFFFLFDGPFLWMGFNCLKTIEILQGEFIFYHYILPTNFFGLNILLCKYTRLNVCVCHQKIAFATWVVIY